MFLRVDRRHRALIKTAVPGTRERWIALVTRQFQVSQSATKFPEGRSAPCGRPVTLETTIVIVTLRNIIVILACFYKTEAERNYANEIDDYRVR